MVDGDSPKFKNSNSAPAKPVYLFISNNGIEDCYEVGSLLQLFVCFCFLVGVGPSSQSPLLCFCVFGSVEC